ncbi:hypothetical protein AC578_910 [Pseudocercospora eumusae]|nr:hypothetical protein AC578_910 [Pseudocercospora eumusae]
MSKDESILTVEWRIANLVTKHHLPISTPRARLYLTQSKPEQLFDSLSHAIVTTLIKNNCYHSNTIQSKPGCTFIVLLKIKHLDKAAESRVCINGCTNTMHQVHHQPRHRSRAISFDSRIKEHHFR